MNKVVKKVLLYFLLIILSISSGVFLSFKNSNDYFVTALDLDELSGDVEVYRNEYSIPTIIAENTDDLFFAQGYEYARDRLWQAEFYRSIATGELSRLFGPDLLDSDKFLRTLRLKESGVLEFNRANEFTKQAVSRYVDGLNKYIDLHINNLPLEFEILDLGQLTSGNLDAIKPKKWKAEDVFAIQGVMAFDLSYDAARRELLRQDLLVGLGAERALELIPVHDPVAEEYFLNATASDFVANSLNLAQTFPLLEPFAQSLEVGSNNWVISGNLTASGNPLLANDLHLALAAPSIWWQVHLYSKDGSYHVEGYSLPGTPGITIGHNENVAWGVTNTGTDSIDIFYFNTRTLDGVEQYFNNTHWKEFEDVIHKIPISGGDEEEFIIKMTDYGPVMDKELFNVTDNKTYVLRWTLFEPIDDSGIFDAILNINLAKSASDMHNAASEWSVPGQNLVFATVDGDIGYQYTGFAPIRKVNGSGVLPQNGSDPDFGWDGYVPYSEHFNIVNPSDRYFVTANAKVDKTDNFYITDLYATDHRTDRITQMLDEGADFTKDDILIMQSDVLNRYAIEVLDPLITHITPDTTNPETTDISKSAFESLSNWDHKMETDSIGATIFATFRIYLEEFTFKDEVVNETNIPHLYEKYAGYVRYIMPSVAKNVSSIWFDDVNTELVVETGDIIATRAFKATIEFLTSKLGTNVLQWHWGRLHKVIFEHPIGDNAPFVDFNEGYIPNNGSSFTVKAAGGSPRWTEDGPEFTQVNGQSMRLIAEAESTWSNVWGIVVPGESGNYGNDHRADSVRDWVETVNHKWDFSTNKTAEATFTFRKKI
ncbi:MAG: Acyl-homoserine lactone acylase QuiP precursor [Candidatus Heimdallarchaeota archaeon LC_2]|nr:MAG: Acyl-homoserine lactone acylase QuiP precursor [Candidatus Heimdallarchaeota archaeon LC_2]